jgi:ectoine hydroxylase-related dioxygenase (phytanoyl-CoA dioxygenase family)
MTRPSSQPRYGVLGQTATGSGVDRAVESIRILGYAVIQGGYDQAWIERLSTSFNRVHQRRFDEYGGADGLRAIDEHNTIRAPLASESQFLELASNAIIIEICRKAIADYFILNQQNGVINPARSEPYNQGAWHRDLPYQHFVSSRPLAISALFCLDSFTRANGATLVIPASHRMEDFPSDDFVASSSVPIDAPAGSFIILDGMVFHRGGVNLTDEPRRGINHVYTIPPIRQQIDLPTMLGDEFTADPALRRLLGYELRTPRNIAEFLQCRRSNRTAASKRESGRRV